MKRKLAEMEEEALKLRKLQDESDKLEDNAASEKEAADARSVYIGNVDYGASPEELQKHFESCGPIQRVTILCDKYSGHPKGFAYIEFKDEESVQTAIALSESVLRGRLIKVLPKRTNLPYFALAQQRGFSGNTHRGHRGGYNYPPGPLYYHQPYYYPSRGIPRGAGYFPPRGRRPPRGGHRGHPGRRGGFHSGLSHANSSSSDEHHAKESEAHNQE